MIIALSTTTQSGVPAPIISFKFHVTDVGDRPSDTVFQKLEDVETERLVIKEHDGAERAAFMLHRDKKPAGIESPQFHIRQYTGFSGEHRSG